MSKGDILFRKYLIFASLSVLLTTNVASAEKVKFALPPESAECKDEGFKTYYRDMAFIDNNPTLQMVTFLDIKRGCVIFLYPKNKCDSNSKVCHVIEDSIEPGTVFNISASRADSGKKYFIGRVKELDSTETDYTKYQAAREAIYGKQ
jgi:hypothetical protein